MHKMLDITYLASFVINFSSALALLPAKPKASD